jgi:aryl-alcohol dehydrogenase-like predicted oxidoreductase
MSPNMERRKLGSGGPFLPVVGMGTWKTFDVRGEVEERARRELVTEALSAGTTVFDSSPMYGESERVLGTALAGRRNASYVATKVWAKQPGEADHQIASALTIYEGRVDLYQVHNLSRTDEVLPKLLDLKSTGQVGRVGATHYRPDAFPELERLMASGKIDAIQVPYNARDRTVEDRVLPMAEELGVGVLVMRPFDEGSLLRTLPPPGLMERLRSKGVHTWAQVLLKWVLSDPRVHVILPATRRPGRPVENAEAGAPPWFNASEREAISSVFDR